VSPEPHDPDAGRLGASHGLAKPPGGFKNEQPGLIASVCSILAGVAGFAGPVVGMIASCVGIWLGVSGFRRGRSASYRPSVIWGSTGVLVSVLGIAYWASAVLFESYR
jgi:hypothetical protein